MKTDLSGVITSDLDLDLYLYDSNSLIPLAGFKDAISDLVLVFAKGRYLSSTANQITRLHSVLLKHRVDWLGLFMARSEPLCLIPI